MRLVHRRRCQAGRKNSERAATVALLRIDARFWCPEEGAGSGLGCEEPGGGIQGTVKADSELAA